MITISTRVQRWIAQNPFIRDELSKGIINHSALARLIVSDIKVSAGEHISLEAVTIALNRIGKQLAESTEEVLLKQFIGDTSLQTGLSIIVIKSDPPIEFPVNRSDYFVITRGIWHTIIITKKKSPEELGIGKDAIVKVAENVAGITIRLEDGNVEVPGVCAFILQGLAIKAVNLIEVVSAHDEMTVFVKQEDVHDALAALLHMKAGKPI